MAEQTKVPKGAKKLKNIPKNRPYYKAQFFRTEKNRARRIRRHIRRHPNDKVAQEALARPSPL